MTHEERLAIAERMQKEVRRLRDAFGADGLTIVVLFHNEKGEHEVLYIGDLPPCITAEELYADLARDEAIDVDTGGAPPGTILS